MGMVVVVAVLGRNIHCVDGDCVMGEGVLGYLFTDFEGRSSLFECRIPTRRRGKKQNKDGVPFHCSGIRCSFFLFPFLVSFSTSFFGGFQFFFFCCCSNPGSL